MKNEQIFEPLIDKKKRYSFSIELDVIILNFFFLIFKIFKILNLFL